MPTQTEPFRFTEDDFLRFDRLGINANSLLDQGYDPEIIYQYSDEIEEESQPTAYEAPSLPPVYEAPQIQTQVQQEAPVMGDVTPDTKLSDLGSLFMGSFNKVLSYPGFLVEKIGEQSGNSNITELGKMLKSGADENAREYFSSLSDQMKRDLEMDFFTYADPEAVIPTGTAKGFFNLNKWLGTIAQGAGSTVIPMGTGAVATGILGRTLLKGFPGLAGALGFGGAGATIEGVGSARDVHDTILETDLETVYRSPMFDAFSEKITQAINEKGEQKYPNASQEQIAGYTRQMIANHAAVSAGKVSGAIIGATSIPFGVLLGRLGIGGAGAARQGFGKAFFKGLTYEGTQEFVQEFSQQIVSNYGVYVSGVPIAPTTGATEAGFGGLLPGSTIGSTTAGVASLVQPKPGAVGRDPSQQLTPEERLTAFAQQIKQEEEAKEKVVTPAAGIPAIPVLQPDVPVRQDVADILQEGGAGLTTGSRRVGGRVSPTEELKLLALEAEKIARLTREEVTEEDIAELNILRNSIGLPTFTLDKIKETLDSTETVTPPPSDVPPTTVAAATPEPDDETNKYFPGLDLETGEDVTEDVAEEVAEEVTPVEEVTEEVAEEVTPVEEVTEEVAPVEEVAEEVTPVEEVTEEVAPVEEVAEEVTPVEEVTEEVTPDYKIEEYKDGRFSVSSDTTPKFKEVNFSKEQADNFVAKLRANPGSTKRAIQGYARLAKVPVDNKETVAAVEKKVEKIKEEDKSKDLETARKLAQSLRAGMEIISYGRGTGVAKKTVKEAQRLAKDLGIDANITQLLLDTANEKLAELEKVPFDQRDFKLVSFYKKHAQELQDNLDEVYRYRDVKAIEQVGKIVKRQLEDMKETGIPMERGVDLSGNIGNLIRILEYDKMKVTVPVTEENPEGIVTLSGAELLRSLNAVASSGISYKPRPYPKREQPTYPKGTKVTKLDTSEIRKRVDRYDKALSALLRRYDQAVERIEQYVKRGKGKDGKKFTEEDGIKAFDDLRRESIAKLGKLIQDFRIDAERMGFDGSEFLPTVFEQSSDDRLKESHKRISLAISKLTTAAGGVEAALDAKKIRSKKKLEEKEVLYTMPERLLSGEVIIHEYHPTKAGTVKVLPGYPKFIPAQKGIDKPKGVSPISYTVVRKSLPQPPLLDEAYWRSYLGSAFDNRLYQSYRKGHIDKETLALWENAGIDQRVLELAPDVTVVTSSDLETANTMRTAANRIKELKRKDDEYIANRVSKTDVMARTGKEGQAARQEYYRIEAERQADTEVGKLDMIDPSTGRPYKSVEEKEWVEKSKPNIRTEYKEPRPYPKKKEPTKIRLKLRDAGLLFSKRKVKDGEEGSINDDDTHNTGLNNVAYHHEKDGDDDIIRMIHKDGSEHGRPIAYLHIEKGVLTQTTKVASALKELGITQDALDKNIGVVMGIVIEQRSRNSGNNLFDEVKQLEGFIPKQKTEVNRFRTMLIEGEISKKNVHQIMSNRPMFEEMKRKIDVLKKASETDLSLSTLEELAYAENEYADKVVEKAMEGVYEVVEGAIAETEVQELMQQGLSRKEAEKEAKLAVSKRPKKAKLMEGDISNKRDQLIRKGEQLYGTAKSGAEQQAEMSEEGGLTDETLRCE